MNWFAFVRLIRMIYGRGLPDINNIQRMGLLAVKIGQIHALRIDFLDAETCFALSKLYRKTVPVATEKALEAVDRNKFEWIDEQPMASASVGQVYKARLKSGEPVAIKIIKKNFKKQFEKDVRSARRLIRFVLFFYPKLSKVFDPMGILDHIEDYTLRELNLLNEIEGHEILKKLYLENREKYDLSRLKFPRIYRELSSENVMVSEYVPGRTFDELLDRDMRYAELLELFKIQGFFMFNLGTFHGDIHPGNLMLHKNNIYFIDTGAIGHVSSRLSRGLMNFFDALSVYDYDTCAKRLNEMAVQRIDGARFQKFNRKFRQLYSDFKGKSVSQVSLTQKMMQTIKLGVNSGMAFEKGMFSIIKSLMFLDGMVLRCDPDAELIPDMSEYIKEFKRLEIQPRSGNHPF